MPCSQWDASRPRSEDVRVIGPVLRFRLLRPRGTRRFGGGLTGPASSRYSRSARPGVGGELLITGSPAGIPPPRFHFPSPPSRKRERLFLFISLLSWGSAITLRSVHVLPAAHNKAILSSRGRPQLRHRRRRRDSLSSRKLPIDYAFSKLDKSLL